MSVSKTPLARSTELAVVTLKEETVVYDLRTDKAHCLNQTAALVWKNCDGTNATGDIARMLETELGAAAPEDVIALAITDLGKAGLLDHGDATTGRGSKGLSRREVIRRTAGMVTIALPLISTLLAPTPASAASTCACVAPGDCISQTGCPSTVNCNPSGMCAP